MLKESDHEEVEKDAFFQFSMAGRSVRLSLETANVGRKKTLNLFLALLLSSLALSRERARLLNEREKKSTVLRPVLPGHPAAKLHRLLRHGLDRHLGSRRPLPHALVHEPRPLLSQQIYHVQTAP